MSEPDDEVGPNNGLDESEDFVYGFDWELEMAWRSRGGSQEDRDWTKAITPADDPDEYPVAFFPDAPTKGVPIKSITSKEYRQLTGAAKPGSYWVGKTPDERELKIIRTLDPTRHVSAAQ